MSVVAFAEKRLNEEVKSGGDWAYWRAYLDGANAARKEMQIFCLGCEMRTRRLEKGDKIETPWGDDE